MERFLLRGSSMDVRDHRQPVRDRHQGVSWIAAVLLLTGCVDVQDGRSGVHLEELSAQDVDSLRHHIPSGKPVPNVDVSLQDWYGRIADQACQFQPESTRAYRLVGAHNVLVTGGGRCGLGVANISIMVETAHAKQAESVTYAIATVPRRAEPKTDFVIFDGRATHTLSPGQASGFALRWAEASTRKPKRSAKQVGGVSTCSEPTIRVLRSAFQANELLSGPTTFADVLSGPGLTAGFAVLRRAQPQGQGNALPWQTHAFAECFDDLEFDVPLGPNLASHIVDYWQHDWVAGTTAALNPEIPTDAVAAAQFFSGLAWIDDVPELAVGDDGLLRSSILTKQCVGGACHFIYADPLTETIWTSMQAGDDRVVVNGPVRAPPKTEWLSAVVVNPVGATSTAVDSILIHNTAPHATALRQLLIIAALAAVGLIWTLRTFFEVLRQALQAAAVTSIGRPPAGRPPNALMDNGDVDDRRTGEETDDWQSSWDASVDGVRSRDSDLAVVRNWAERLWASCLWVNQIARTVFRTRLASGTRTRLTRSKGRLPIRTTTSTGTSFEVRSFERSCARCFLRADFHEMVRVLNLARRRNFSWYALTQLALWPAPNGRCTPTDKVTSFRSLRLTLAVTACRTSKLRVAIQHWRSSLR